MSNKIELKVNDAFYDYEVDWKHKYYVLIGGYGSSKSYSTAEKIILKCLTEKRKVLVAREVFETIKESCFDLMREILDKMDLLEEENVRSSSKVIARQSPMQFIFPNGSRIIFKGMDKPVKIKSINGVSIVWMEEAAEIKYAAFKELIGRVRTPDQSIHFILTCNPVGIDTWVYRHFFKKLDDDGEETVILDDEKLYEHGCIIKNDVFYHHSVPEDNLFLSQDYINTLDEMKEYDPDLWRIAKEGRFGPNGVRVLNNFYIAKSHEDVIRQVQMLGRKNIYNGMDFGYETSYNALIRCSVDTEKQYLYVFWEYYRNHRTDPQAVKDLDRLGWNKNNLIVADCAEPKTISFYNQEGFRMRGASKATRLENTKKMKRFKKIICSPNCPNTIRELKNLTYAKNPKDEIIYDEFNIDPHTFSALWYALDTVTVANIKYKKRITRKGERM